MTEPLYLHFKPLEWRCTLQRLQQITHRRIDGPGVWVASDIRINDEILQTTLPLTFTIQIGREEGGDVFGLVPSVARAFSPADLDLARDIEPVPIDDHEGIGIMPIRHAAMG
jgi:hypothetical protein